MSKESNNNLEILTVNANESLTDVDSPSPDSWMKKLAANRVSNESDEDVEVKPRCSSPLFKTPLRKWRNCKRKTLKLECPSSPSPHDNSDHIEGIGIFPLTLTSTPVQLIGQGLNEEKDTQDRVVESLGTLFDEGNVSWTSSLATPRAPNVTWNNLNTEEKKVLLPCQDPFNKSNGPQTPGSEDVLLQRVSDFSHLEELSEQHDTSPDIFVCSQQKQVRKDGSSSPICGVKLKKRCKHKRTRKAQFSVKGASELKKNEVCLECPSVSKRLFTTKDNLEQCPEDSSTMCIKEDSSKQTRKEYLSETVASDDFLTPKLPKPPPKFENTKNIESALTQNFFHDISFSTLEEVCQASEMMISPEVSPSNDERESFLLDVSEGCQGDGKDNYLSVQQNSTPLQKSCTSGMIRKKRIKFLNDSVNNSEQIGHGVKRLVEVDDVPKFDPKRQCSKQGKDLSADPVKFYNGFDENVISRVKLIKSMKQTRHFYYSPVSEVNEHSKAEESTLQLNPPPGLNNRPTHSGGLESFCPFTEAADCRSESPNKNAVQDQQTTSNNGSKKVISSGSHKYQEKRLCPSSNSGLLVKGMENCMKQSKCAGVTEKECNSNLSTECHSSPKRDKKRLREEVHSTDCHSVKTSRLSPSNSRHSSDLVIRNTKLRDSVNSTDVPYDISEHINNRNKSTSPEVITNHACRYEEKEKVKQDFSNIVQDHNHSFTDTQMVHAVEDIEILLQLLEEEKNCQKNHSKLLQEVPNDSNSDVTGTASRIENVLDDQDQENKNTCKKLREFSSDKSPEIKGFSTAAGNIISVSEDALIKAKRLFENESDILTSETLQQFENKPSCTRNTDVEAYPVTAQSGNGIMNTEPSGNTTEIVCRKTLIGSTLQDPVFQFEERISSNVKSVQETAPKNTAGMQEKVTDSSTCFKFKGTTAVSEEIEGVRTEFCEVNKSLNGDNGMVNKISRVSEQENQSGVNDRDLGKSIQVFKEIYQTHGSNETHFEAPVKHKPTSPGDDHTLKSAHQIQQIAASNSSLTKDELIDVRPLNVQDMKGDSLSEDFIKKEQDINCENSGSVVALEVQGFVIDNRKTINQFNDSLEREQNQFTDYSSPIRPGSFSTASDKPVCVSEKSLHKVQNMFTDNPSPVQPLDFPPANDKAVYESENSFEKRLNGFAGDLIHTRALESSTANGKFACGLEDSLKKPQRVFTENSTPVQHSEAQGFSTASGEAVHISEHSLKRAHFSTASGKAVQISEDSLKRAQKLFAEDSSPVRPSITDGFSTASGKAVKTSEDSLKIAQKLFAEDSTPIRPSKLHSFSTASGKDVQISEDSLKRAQKLFAEDSNPVQPSTTQGFSTASGKAVTISEDSLKRAQTLFADDSTPIRPSEAQGFSTASGKAVQISEDSLKIAQKLFADDSAPVRPSETRGFSTASGKAVQISDDSLKKAQKLFAEDSAPVRPSITDGFSTASGKAVKTSEDSLKIAQKLFAEDSTPIRPSKLHSFSTASGKDVQISEDSLKRAQKLFAEDSTPVQPSKTHGFSTASGKAVKISEDSLKIAQKLFADDSTPVRPSETRDFSTASGKAVPISDDSLKRAQKLFAEVTTLVRPSEEHGFSTSSGKAVQIPEDSLERAPKLFAECSSPIRPSKLHSFSTASGKGVQISEDSLKRAQKLFAEDSTPVQPSITRGFSTASGRAVKISEDSLKRAQKLFTDDSTPVRPSVAQGFSTASGKAVQISEDSLKRAQELFAEDSTLVTPSEDHGSSTASGKAVQIPEDSLERAPKLFAEFSTPVRPSKLHSFSTASGKDVQISEDSLKRAQKLFAEDSTPVRPSAVQGFSTVNGKSGQISENSLKRAQKLFTEDSSPVRPKESQGFSTASGKAVQISEASLKRAQTLFAEDSTPVRPSVAQGFSTASGKAVQISEDSLKRAQKFFAEDSTPVRPSTAQGFSMASGRAVKISEDSLKKAQKLYADDSIPIRPFEAQDFSTASGKAVQISDDSLKIAQKLFAEDSTPFRPSVAQAFSTDTGRSVQVSEDSEDSATVRSSEHLDLTSWKAFHGSEDSVERPRNIFTDDSSPITSSEIRGFPSKNRKVASSRDVLCMSFSQKAAVSSNDFVDDENELSRLVTDDQHFSLLNDTEWNTSFSLVKTDSVKKGHISKASKEFYAVPTLSQEVQECTSAILADELLVDENLDKVETTPSWLTTFVTGPEMLYDRENAPQPVLASADNGRVPRPNSPVLGRSDRFKRGKRKSNCQVFFGDNSSLKEVVPVTSSSFKVPYKKMGAAKNHVRKESSKQATSRLAFGTPFWKDNGGKLSSRFDLPACSNVQEARQKAAQDQQKLINEGKSSNWTRPCKGSLLFQKLKEREKQISWRQMTSGKPPTQYSVQQLLKYGLKENVIKVTAENAKDFKFCAWHYYSPKYSAENTTGLPVGDGAILILDDKNQAGVEEVTRAFLSSPGVVPSLVPPGWIHNHYRWLVWKLAATERSFPHLFANRCLTPNVLMLQLKYRYDREIDLSQRPALRKILEKDDSPGKSIVLCVVRVIQLQSKEGEKQEDERIHSRLTYELELTDGWYSVIAAVDQEMCCLIQSGKITVGTKIITHGAELVNCDEGCSPLEVSSNVRLKLHTNSTRRARWDTKLGFFSHPGPLNVSLNSILPRGGLVSCTTVIIARVYPMLYVEKTSDGKSVIRSERAEALEAARFEQYHQQRMESLYSQERKDMFKNTSKTSRSIRRMSRAQVAKLTSGQELCELLDTAPDPATIEAMLNEDQRQILAEYQQNYQEQMMRELETRVRERLGEDKLSSRTVTSLLKVRCLDPKSPSHHSVMLSVWRAPEEIVTLLKEGSVIKLYNVTCMGVRCGEKQLSGGRQTRYKPLPVVKLPLELVFPHRTVTNLKQAVAKDFNPPFGELDIVGVVVSIENEPQGNSNINTVFVANAELVVLGISFWGGIKKFGWEDILKSETFIAASNLQWRQGAASRWIPCAYATELSIFSQNPRQNHLRSAIDGLKEAIHMDLKNFVSTCQNVILSLRANPESAAAAHSHHKRPSPVKLINNIRPTSPSPIEMRLYRLEQYEEPPPLPPLFLGNNRSILTKEFHIPVVTGDNIEEEESPPLSLDSDPG